MILAHGSPVVGGRETEFMLVIAIVLKDMYDGATVVGVRSSGGNSR